MRPHRHTTASIVASGKSYDVRIELPELDVRQPALARAALGDGEHGCGLVRRNHAAGWTDAPRDRQRGVADSGGDVDDRMAGYQFQRARSSGR